jgi:hypothetical protein
MHNLAHVLNGNATVYYNRLLTHAIAQYQVIQEKGHVEISVGNAIAMPRFVVNA